MSVRSRWIQFFQHRLQVSLPPFSCSGAAFAPCGRASLPTLGCQFSECAIELTPDELEFLPARFSSRLARLLPAGRGSPPSTRVRACAVAVAFEVYVPSWTPLCHWSVGQHRVGEASGFRSPKMLQFALTGLVLLRIERQLLPTTG